MNSDEKIKKQTNFLCFFFVGVLFDVSISRQMLDCNVAERCDFHFQCVENVSGFSCCVFFSSVFLWFNRYAISL